MPSPYFVTPSFSLFLLLHILVFLDCTCRGLPDRPTRPRRRAFAGRPPRRQSVRRGGIGHRATAVDPCRAGRGDYRHTGGGGTARALAVAGGNGAGGAGGGVVGVPPGRMAEESRWPLGNRSSCCYYRCWPISPSWADPRAGLDAGGPGQRWCCVA